MYDHPVKIADIKQCALNAGLRIDKKWNLSSILRRSSGKAILMPDGWELTDIGKEHLRDLGVSEINSFFKNAVNDLRIHLSKVENLDTRAFVEEAIKCHENSLYRSSIVMSWIAAVDVLHKRVVSEHLDKFNEEAKRINSKWKTATNADGLGRINEESFLNICSSIGILGKNQKDELLKCLKLRNGCGHPNSLQVGPHAVAHHLETLLLNVFKI